MRRLGGDGSVPGPLPPAQQHLVVGSGARGWVQLCEGCCPQGSEPAALPLVSLVGPCEATCLGARPPVEATVPRHDPGCPPGQVDEERLRASRCIGMGAVVNHQDDHRAHLAQPRPRQVVRACVGPGSLQAHRPVRQAPLVGQFVVADAFRRWGDMVVRDRSSQVCGGAWMYPLVPAGGSCFLAWPAQEVRSASPKAFVPSPLPGGFSNDIKEFCIFVLDLDD